MAEILTIVRRVRLEIPFGGSIFRSNAGTERTLERAGYSVSGQQRKSFVVRILPRWTSLMVSESVKTDIISCVPICDVLSQGYVHKSSGATALQGFGRQSGRRRSAKLVPTFEGREVSRGQRNGSPRPLISVYRTWIATYFIQVAPQLTSRGWVYPVPDPLPLRKCGSAGNRTRDLCICSQKLWPLDHRSGQDTFIQLTNVFEMQTEDHLGGE
jgi:hypothetical protein